jgi:hypothetical protein
MLLRVSLNISHSIPRRISIQAKRLKNQYIMAPKRLRGDNGGNLPEAKKQRKGFSVGPANLPDGTYRRKSRCLDSSKLGYSY